MEETYRRPYFERNKDLERLLTELNDLLAVPERTAVQDLGQPDLPVIFVVGCPRSGSTLLLQSLAQRGDIAYPSNLLSRFYRAPYIGVRIEQMLRDPKYAYRDEMSGILHRLDYQSSLGKTSGIFSPNEFYYFLRRFFLFHDTHKLTDEQLRTVDTTSFVAELAGIVRATGKPFALKALILDYHIGFLAKAIEKSIFVYLRRRPFYNAQSILEARLNYYGSRDAWYSLKPPEYLELVHRPSHEQVAAQLYLIERAVEAQLSSIDSSRVIQGTYEGFCSDPAEFHARVTAALRRFGFGGEPVGSSPSPFSSSHHVRLDPDDAARLVSALRQYYPADSIT